MKKELLKERFQELAGIHNIHEGNFDELKKQANESLEHLEKIEESLK